MTTRSRIQPTTDPTIIQEVEDKIASIANIQILSYTVNGQPGPALDQSFQDNVEADIKAGITATITLLQFPSINMLGRKTIYMETDFHSCVEVDLTGLSGTLRVDNDYENFHADGNTTDHVFEFSWEWSLPS